MNAISPKRDEDFSSWYQNVVSMLAKHGKVRGTQVITPWGYGIWEHIQADLNIKIKSYDCENFYAPLFVGLDALSQESKHIQGFAPECAVVTHSRLIRRDGELVPDGKLTEPVVVRPTSEAIIGPIAKDWIESHRDLPLKLNQWANVVRWERRTRLFLRSSEFLWQEGHTFHKDAEEAHDFARTMWKCYEGFVKDLLAMPCVMGEKPCWDRFFGSKHSYTFELMMQDGKALQGGTSHYLADSFSKAYDITYTDADSKVRHVHGTSWGVTTRLVGALVMMHGDDDGLRIPPKVAPLQVVIIPVNPKDDPKVDEACEQVKSEIAKLNYHGLNVRVKVDNREMRGGNKSWDWIKKGVPVRIEIGPRDLENQTVCVARRDRDHKDKMALPISDLANLVETLDEIHNGLYEDALGFLEQNTHVMDSKEAVFEHFQSKTGFVKVPCADDASIEAMLAEHQLSARCLLKAESATCVFTGKQTSTIAVIAKAY